MYVFEIAIKCVDTQNWPEIIPTMVVKTHIPQYVLTLKYISFLPFLQSLHESPYDIFTRYTGKYHQVLKKNNQ